MADKTLTFKIDITGVSNEANEMAKIELQSKNTKKEKQKLKKFIDSAPDSFNRMRADLISLKNEYANGSAELRQNLVPQINRFHNAISNAEQAIGVHQRGVGNYKGGIMEAAKELLGFGGAVAIGT